MEQTIESSCRWFKTTRRCHCNARKYGQWPLLLTWFNTLRPRQNGRHFADDTFKPIFLNENIRISIKISLKFVPKVPINNIPTFVQIMSSHRPGDKPLSEPVMVCLLMHICVAQSQDGYVITCLLKCGVKSTYFLKYVCYIKILFCGHTILVPFTTRERVMHTQICESHRAMGPLI